MLRGTSLSLMTFSLSTQATDTLQLYRGSRISSYGPIQRIYSGVIPKQRLGSAPKWRNAAILLQRDFPNPHCRCDVSTCSVQVLQLPLNPSSHKRPSLRSCLAGTEPDSAWKLFGLWDFC